MGTSNSKVTPEKALKELGSIYYEELLYPSIKENEYIIDGSTKIDDVNQELNINLKSEEFDTIGGYLIGVLGYFPKANKIIKTDGLEFIVECVEKNRIEKVRAKLIDVKLKENNREIKYNKN